MWLYRYESGDSTRLPQQDAEGDEPTARDGAPDRNSGCEPLASLASNADDDDEARGLSGWIAPLISRLGSARAR